MARTALKNRIPSSQLFLMELLLSLLLFSVASAASLAVFVRAHKMSEKASVRASASADLSSLAELIRRSSDYVDVLDRASKEYPEAQLTDSSILVFFDGEHRETDEEHAVYRMCALLSMQDSILHADMGYTDDPEADISALTAEAAASYTPEDSSSDMSDTGEKGLVAFLQLDHYVKEGAL